MSIEQVSKEVVRNISIISGFEPSKVGQDSRLEKDLGMSGDLRGALAPGFKRIARNYDANAVITKAACKKLEKVSDAVELVVKAAGLS